MRRARWSLKSPPREGRQGGSSGRNVLGLGTERASQSRAAAELERRKKVPILFDTAKSRFAESRKGRAWVTTEIPSGQRSTFLQGAKQETLSRLALGRWLRGRLSTGSQRH